MLGLLIAATGAALFANPPNDLRILPLQHGYPDDLAAVSNSYREAQALGFGGRGFSVRFDDGSPAPRYLDNPVSCAKFGEIVALAEQMGMALWFYDELGYPSLSSGDRVLRGRPDLEQTGWMIATNRVSAGAPVELALPPGRFVGAVAAKCTAAGEIVPDGFIDLASSVADTAPLQKQFCRASKLPEDADGRPALGLARSRGEIKTGPLTWRAPEGDGDYLVFAVTEDYIYDGTHPDMKGFPLKYRYPNPLLRESTERFLAVNHAAVAKLLGGRLGDHFISTFADEPSLMGNWWKPMPFLVASSAPGLAERYARRTNGRDLIADLPYLVADSADGNALAGRVRIAFWDESARMYEEAFFKPIADWCAKEGLLSGGHLMGEEHFCFHVSHYGDFFRCLKAMTAPGLDSLTSTPTNVPYLAALFAGSARELIGSPRAMVEVSDISERYRKRRVSEDELQGTLNRLLWAGINSFTSYANGYLRSIDEDGMRRTNLRLGRANYLLQTGGHTAADVALYYPAKDAMRLYRLSHHIDAQALEKDTPLGRLQCVFEDAARNLYEDARCFMIVDEDTLENAKAVDGELRFGELKWKAVVLPDVKTISLRAKETLRAFRDQGGILIRADGKANVAAVLRERLEPHARFWIRDQKDPNPLRLVHRRNAHGDVFFVMNDSPRPVTAMVRLCGDPEDVTEWDPETGSSRRPWIRDSKFSKVMLKAYGAVLFTTPMRCEPGRKEMVE